MSLEVGSLESYKEAHVDTHNGRQNTITSIADNIQPGWRESVPEGTSYEDMKSNLAKIHAPRKREIILNYLRALHYYKKKIYFSKIKWREISQDDITGWPTESWVPYRSLEKLKNHQLT